VRKIIAISLSLILLLSNAGLTLASHYCGGEAVGSTLMLGPGNLDCGMPEAPQNCEIPAKDTTSMEAADCCQNAFTTLEVEEQMGMEAWNITQNSVFAVAFAISCLDILTIAPERQNFQYLNHSPPLPRAPLRILFQSFLL
jgi:hypothetical protein